VSERKEKGGSKETKTERNVTRQEGRGTEKNRMREGEG
jgi:hypothetical protein